MALHIRGYSATIIKDIQYPPDILIDFKAHSTGKLTYQYLQETYPDRLVTTRNNRLLSPQRSVTHPTANYKCYMYGGYNVSSFNLNSDCLFEFNFGKFPPVKIDVRFSIPSLNTDSDFYFNFYLNNTSVLHGHKAGSSAITASGNGIYVNSKLYASLTSSAKTHLISLVAGTNYTASENMTSRFLNAYGYPAGSGYPTDVYNTYVYFDYIKYYFNPNTI